MCDHKKIFKCIRECVNPWLLYDCIETDFDQRVIIREEDKNSKSIDYKIKGLNKEHTLVIKADKFKCIYHPRTDCNVVSKLLNPDKTHLFENCDYIIMTAHKGSIYCIFLENKDSGRGKNSKIKRQLEKTKLFWDYFLNLVKYYKISKLDFKYIFIFSSKRKNAEKEFKHKCNKRMKVFKNKRAEKKVYSIPQRDVHISKLISYIMIN